ncbi:MAG: hypothetical protein ABJ387_05180 [Balneola sp.]
MTDNPVYDDPFDGPGGNTTDPYTDLDSNNQSFLDWILNFF